MTCSESYRRPMRPAALMSLTRRSFTDRGGRQIQYHTESRISCYQPGGHTGSTQSNTSDLITFQAHTTHLHSALETLDLMILRGVHHLLGGGGSCCHSRGDRGRRSGGRSGTLLEKSRAYSRGLTCC